MGLKTRGEFHVSVFVGLEVAQKAFVGNDYGFLESVNPLSILDVDVATCIRDGKEGVFNNQLLWGVFEMDPHVLEVHHWVVEVVVDDVCRQLAEAFSGVRDDGVEVDLEVQEADFWGAGVAVVGEFVAVNYQANAVRFSFGQLDVADKIGNGYLFTFWDGVFGDKEDGIGPFNTFGGETGYTSTLCQAEKFIGSGDFPSCFLGARPESVERVFDKFNGVNHRGSGGNDGAWLIVASVLSWVPMWR